ncbi:16S rRNA (guanine(966)-N(2))-methyltransferase RsmD [Desulfoscipio geothermicus]|uniref:16S rRNA (Guanine(966)-N(2))-methyltransferase RsmD n=1 Tax=Desulfoscipio geothermicus DSM 3669 TaxID=1121426 RepID=A0A1I6DIU0_9FIRM|nr:16S rRNA (guanine(966)-N(2))-methyltransferase RsmD [Desulfoscipio geothermicus]SFR05375.1 16S rRNA (guanine(966)-N(2))-methyltransferase RsmD [Desulfoscipio geothermicus DSM 3669]
MRVIAGIAKKRRLKSPGKLPVRPTADRVKESLFNILGSRLPGSIFADLYAGTGGVGIEALSRGAGKVVFVEKNLPVARILMENIALTGLQAGAEIITRDVEAALKILSRQHITFDIIFADPPYRQGQAARVLNILSKVPVLRKNGILVLEIAANENIPEKAGAFTMWRREKYGDTALVFCKPDTEEDMFCE